MGHKYSYCNYNETAALKQVCHQTNLVSSARRNYENYAEHGLNPGSCFLALGSTLTSH
jgi:hypothetical protein